MPKDDATEKLAYTLSDLDYVKVDFCLYVNSHFDSRQEYNVDPFFEEPQLPLLRILTDRGTEYCGRDDAHHYQLYQAINDIHYTKTMARSPQTNGFCERFHNTINCTPALPDTKVSISRQARHKWSEKVVLDGWSLKLSLMCFFQFATVL